MNILDNRYLLISVIGSHAGEDILPIFLRKKEEIIKNGKTYWLIKSFRAKTADIQELGRKAAREGEALICIFIGASAKNGARPTTHDSAAKRISDNGSGWTMLSDDVKITGKIDRQSTAIVFSELEILDKPLTVDLWDYSDLDGSPVRLQLGASTACAMKRLSAGMKSRTRSIIGWGKLKPPYAVWVE